MSSVLANIHNRISIRTYQEQKLDEDVRQKLVAFMKAINHGPFGNPVRFELVEVKAGDVDALKELGTYGWIHGALLYIAGAVVKADKSNEDYGYALESIILKATELGLGTVWLAGSLNRTTFSQKINLKDNEVLPAVTPVGYQAGKQTLKERVIKSIVRSTSRRNFAEIFYEGNAGTPLPKQAIGPYGEILEGVRLAPSASNKQPWRIIKEPGKNTFHFYLDEDKSYNTRFPNIRIQNIDMGIAMCHFELAASELGVAGKWVVAEPDLQAGKLIYTASWQG